MKTLIVYATRYGTTRECATLLSEKLQGETVMHDLVKHSQVNLQDFDTIVVGGAIYAGTLHKKVRKFCKVHENELLTKQLALFTCNMEEGEGEMRQLEKNYPPALVAHAIVKSCFGGQFLFAKMGWFTKKIITKINKSDTDVKKLHYEVIDQFAQTLNSKANASV
ncbi:MAG: flavodoxin domain-containing protein [Sphaerochaetaceae bacterium]